MKKLAILPLFLLIPAMLLACEKGNQNNEKVTLTYGSMFDKTVTEILTNDELVNKIENEQETFLLALHYGDTPSCGCWMTFKNQLNKLINNYHVRIYSMNFFKINDYEKYGFDPLNADEPSFYIIANGKIIEKYNYKKSSLKEFFHDSEAIKTEIEKHIQYPNFYYVTKDFLQEKLFDNPVEKAAVFYMRTKCGDCKYCLPNFMIPYGNENQLKIKVWIYDLQDLYDADKEGEYVQTKELFKLTETADNNYGYSTGVVPTTQYWENGALKDASVYFNDSVEKTEKGYEITDSYYTQERLSKLNYLSNVETKVLKGLVLPNDDVEYYEEYNYCAWNQIAAAKYHDSLIKAFYDTYLK